MGVMLQIIRTQWNCGNISSSFHCFLFDSRNTVLKLWHRHKGHSKWQNIRHTKMANDVMKQRIFSKLAYKIGVAIRGNNMQTDPHLNRDLEKLIEECQAKNMPKVFIERAIERAVSKPLQTIHFDAKGPGGSLFILETLTDRKDFTKNMIQKCFNKVGGFSFADQGIRRFFEQKGIIMVAKSFKEENTNDKRKQASNNSTSYELSLEEAINVAIDVGAEDVTECEDDDGVKMLEFISDPLQTAKVCNALVSRNFQVRSSENEFRSTIRVHLEENQLETVEACFKALENVEAIAKIFDNIEPSEDSHGGATNSLWNTENGKPILSNNISLHNFQRIFRQIQFDDHETTLHCHEKDLLAAIRDMWDDWVACLSMMLNPGAYVTANERLIPFKGSGSFRQHMLKSQQSMASKFGTFVTPRLAVHSTYRSSQEDAHQKELTTLGTMKKNKPDLPQELLEDAPFSTGRDCKPEMILDYNATKRASNNGYLLWAHCNPECDVNKMYLRRLHLEKLEKAPLTPQIHRRKRLPGPLTATYFAPNVQIKEQGTSKSTIKQKAFRM
ncbi:Translational activator of cytochrome c oxidase 1 [Trichinella pseudospiralis]|uniref:Translational activator of cytochrome c oxidase 1 n=1 Tax=Trichinella pseudospiralis TaxID=6337 RepID=A0A0V0Y7I0_TRIPS|nr:Translational activator of cytochrome c oxidase 1 [Trichinella pseudospiralis]